MVPWNKLTRETAHRPWPLPRSPWLMTMSWLDLLFAHWSLPLEDLRACIPEDLEVDTFQGRAWLSVVPFRMESVGPRGLHFLPGNLPGTRAFPELNLRTYVISHGKPGVWFFSLDATSPLAVWGARRFFHLPYFRARIHTQERNGWIEYDSERTDPRLGPGIFRGRYRPVGERLKVRPGTLEHWLTERYCLYAANRRGTTFRGHIHHPPWPLFPAEAKITTNTVAEAHGLRLEGPPLLHFSRQIHVVGWGLQSVTAD